MLKVKYSHLLTDNVYDGYLLAKLMKNIWILEDDPNLSYIYQEVLQVNYQLKLFNSLESLRHECLSQNTVTPDFLIADLQLPDGSFLDLISQDDIPLLNSIPFMIVSASDGSDSLIKGFEEGAIDFIVKPFSLSELSVKLGRAINKAETLSRQVTPKWDDYHSNLTLTELKILAILEDSYPAAVSREDITEKVWKSVRVDTNVLDVHLYGLRKKLRPFQIEIKSVGHGVWCLQKQSN